MKHPPDKRERVLELLRQPDAKQWIIAAQEGVSPSTIRRWLAEESRNRRNNYGDSGGIVAPPTCKSILQSHVNRVHKPKVNVPPPKEPQGIRIAVIPDMQVKPGIDLSYCRRIGLYMADKMPDVIVNIGDFADMPSLSTHDPIGCKRMEGARYEDDILAAQTAMRLMMTPIKEKMAATGWNPRLVMTLGNHEERIRRAVESTPKWEGRIGLCDLHYEEWGWEVYPFLQPVVIEGIAFAHYFCSGVMGKPITKARMLLTNKHMSCFAGHQQGRDFCPGTRADGREMVAIIAGSCYEHDEPYLNPQTNNHWRGLYILNDVVDGSFEENAVSLKYLRRKYGD